MVDSLITLFEPSEKEFVSGGLGNLSEATKCEVTEERNGGYELVLEYPIFGEHYSQITYRSIIFAKPNPFDKPQPFRVYSISRPMRGIVTFNARHIRYDLTGYPIAPFMADNLTGVFTELNNQMAKPWNKNKPPFHFTNDNADAKESVFDLLSPCSALSLLGGTEGSVLELYEGEYEWDKWECILHKERGADRGVTIAYGKNLTDLTQDEDCENVYTGVYPYWYSEEDGLVELGTDDKIIPLEGTFDHENTYILDLSGEFQDKPTPEQLREFADIVIKESKLGTPTVSLTVSFYPLSDTLNYSDISGLEEVRLCDTVHVIFPKLGVTADSKCITTTYNCLTGKYISIELGDPKEDLTSTISNNNAAIESRPTTTYVKQVVDHQNDLITGNKGGYFVIHDSDGDNKPDEALFMDTDDIATAVHVLRINKSGIGFSSTGYNGTYETAWTLDGTFNAKFVTAGTMLADRILGGMLKLGGQEDGSIQLFDATNRKFGYIDKTGIHFSGVFDLNADGNANFAGNVYAKNIQVGVGSDGVDRGHISGGQIGAGQVGTGNLADEGVTNGKLSGGSVSSGKLMDGSVIGSKYADNSITTDKIENRTIDKAALKNCTTDGTSLGLGGSDTISASSGIIYTKAVYAVELSAAGATVSIGSVSGGSGRVNLHGTTSVSGSLSVTGDKNRLIKTKYGDRLLSASETPMPTFSDYGTAKLDELGECYLCTDPIFMETVNSNIYPTIFLTPYGSGSLYVANVDHDMITIKGDPGMTFAWETRYTQTNTYAQRLSVAHFDQPDTSSEHDFDSEAKVHYDHSLSNMDYGSLGANYYTEFERSLLE